MGKTFQTHLKGCEAWIQSVKEQIPASPSDEFPMFPDIMQTMIIIQFSN